MIKVEMIEYPTEKDWIAVKERALVTIGKKLLNPPDEKWKKDIIRARHSPIRRLNFSFYIECPYWVSVHLCRHIHAQPYVQSQRNDRQDKYDRTKAPQDEMVSMIWDMNAEELLNIANKRLCNLTAKETKEVVTLMCASVIDKLPEFKRELVPACARNGRCFEMKTCSSERLEIGW